jgi:DOPA 4,5-dioxygenase
VLVHPNTSYELRDHRDSALWIGHSHALNLHAFDD